MLEDYGLGYQGGCAPNEAKFRVAICKSKTERPEADGADEFVDDVFEQDVANVLGAHAARLPRKQAVRCLLPAQRPEDLVCSTLAYTTLAAGKQAAKTHSSAA